MPGGSYLVGGVTIDPPKNRAGSPPQLSFHGDNTVYLYPDLQHAMVGKFDHGKMVEGQFGKVTQWKTGSMLPFPEVSIEYKMVYRHDPSTGMRIR